METTSNSERKILDSGNRREFESGAVRDIAEGKGRCDLLPLDVISSYFSSRVDSSNPSSEKAITVCAILDLLNTVLMKKSKDDLDTILNAVRVFIGCQYSERDGLAILELAKHYEAGAVKYGERNWEKGIPVHCYIDSCVRHLLKWFDGWSDEPHDRAVIWNLFGLAWTLINRPEYDDRPTIGGKK